MKEPVAVDAHEAWQEVGRRLSEVDPINFARLLALARAYVSVHDRVLERAEIFRSRIAQILPGVPKASA